MFVKLNNVMCLFSRVWDRVWGNMLVLLLFKTLVVVVRTWTHHTWFNQYQTWCCFCWWWWWIYELFLSVSILFFKTKFYSATRIENVNIHIYIESNSMFIYLTKIFFCLISVHSFLTADIQIWLVQHTVCINMFFF